MAKCPRSGAKFLWQGQVVTAVPAGHIRGHRSNATCFKEGGETLAVVRMGAGHNRYYPPLKELKPLPEQLRVPPLMHVDRWRTESYGFPQPVAPGVNGITEADEAATSRSVALQNYAEKLQQFERGEETYGVLQMYEQAALDAGVTTQELTQVQRKAALRGIEDTDTLRLYGSCVKKCRRHAPHSLGPCIDACQKGGQVGGTDDFHTRNAQIWAGHAVEEAELGAGDALDKGQCNRALESLVRAERKTTMASTHATQVGDEQLRAKARRSNSLVNALWREFQSKCVRRDGDQPGSVLPFGGVKYTLPDVE